MGSLGDSLILLLIRISRLSLNVAPAGRWPAAVGLTLAGGKVDYRIWPRWAEIAWGGWISKGSWRNWQTRKVEGLVPARACWFDSSRAHLANERGANAFERELAVAPKPPGQSRGLLRLRLAVSRRRASFFALTRRGPLFCAHAAVVKRPTTTYNS